ncbi:hypothetical protein RvY_07750 [Ramazzottius varieornatus]|uniref:Uncharacterized protein n=1 Tax=Ramazzottius varieornatus TaxID=947166 RepID=A0A1D1V8B8_RAMVA|nr:hypothetical protein RvY_07750 [Ramazzottius varieornatus]
MKINRTTARLTMMKLRRRPRSLEERSIRDADALPSLASGARFVWLPKVIFPATAKERRTNPSSSHQECEYLRSANNSSKPAVSSFAPALMARREASKMRRNTCATDLNDKPTMPSTRCYPIDCDMWDDGKWDKINKVQIPGVVQCGAKAWRSHSYTWCPPRAWFHARVDLIYR